MCRHQQKAALGGQRDFIGADQENQGRGKTGGMEEKKSPLHLQKVDLQALRVD